MKKLILLLALAVCAFGQIPFNSRGAWQASTLYTVGDTFTCTVPSATYYVAATYVSGASCLLTSTGTADLVQLNYTAVGSLPDELLSLSYPRLLNNLYFMSQHIFDRATYNDLTQISTPAAPSAGLLRLYSKGNLPCWITNGGSEVCAGTANLAGDVTGTTGANSVVKLQGRALAATSPTNGQVIGWSAGGATWQPLSLPYQTMKAGGSAQTQRGSLNLIAGSGVTITPADNAGGDSTDVTIVASGTAAAGSAGDYQKNNGSGGFSAGSVKEDANNPYSAKAMHAAAATVTFSATPTFDIAAGNRLEIMLTGNVTSSTWSHLRGGAKFSVPISQDGTGAHSLVWPVGTLNACSPWQIANSVTTLNFEVASDGSTVTASNCSVYDPANPGVVFYGLMRGSIPTPAAGNLACGFDSGANDWHCVDPSGKNYYATLDRTAVSHFFVTGISAGVQTAAQPAIADLSDATNVNTLNGNQTITGNKTYTGSTDASGASHTLPSKTGAAASKPATCTVGEVYFANDATAGQNEYYCTSTNTWTQQSGGSVTAGAGITVSAGAVSLKFFDNSLWYFDETFMGAQTANPWGTYGWIALATNSTNPTVASIPVVDLDVNHFGGLKLTTAATATQGGYFVLRPSNASAGIPTTMLQSGTFRPVELQFQFKLGQTTNTRFYAGLANILAPASAFSNGCFIRADVSTSVAGGTPDTALMAVCGDTSTTTASAISGGTLDTSWHHGRIWATAVGSWNFSIDGGATTTISKTPATNSYVWPVILIQTDTTASSVFFEVSRIQGQITSLSVN